jgi:hypothetical protein
MRRNPWHRAERLRRQGATRVLSPVRQRHDDDQRHYQNDNSTNVAVYALAVPLPKKMLLAFNSARQGLSNGKSSWPST